MKTLSTLILNSESENISYACIKLLKICFLLTVMFTVMLDFSLDSMLTYAKKIFQTFWTNVKRFCSLISLKNLILFTRATKTSYTMTGSQTLYITKLRRSHFSL